MKRTPEPEELMDETDQALAYAEADFSASNELFLDLFAQLQPGDFDGRILDLGCGPADIPLRFARRYSRARIDALDGAPAMLELARQSITREGLDERIRLHCQYLPTTRLKREYDAVVSNSLLHHLQDPLDLWRSIDACTVPGGQVLVMDLLRPESPGQVNALVTEYAADAPEVLRRDFHASLHAAYTLEEIRQQLKACGLDHLETVQVSDRHLAVRGQMP
jgi:cyclopropane fatty-acyl-phospholipid synthase-like methyltransferase